MRHFWLFFVAVSSTFYCAATAPLGPALCTRPSPYRVSSTEPAIRLVLSSVICRQIPTYIEATDVAESICQCQCQVHKSCPYTMIEPHNFTYNNNNNN